jgi:hypothetical protein
MKGNLSMLAKNYQNYLPIVTSSTKQTFFDYIGSLDIPQIDYFAIGVQNPTTKKSISLMSLPEWQKHFTDNQYADYDPIRRASLYTKRNLIPFSEIDFVDNFGQEIMRQRALAGIINGIILMERSPKCNYIITLGTGFSNFHPFDFIKKYHDKLHFIKNDLIDLVKKDAYLFLSNSPSTSS